jgi:hypothetical protein
VVEEDAGVVVEVHPFHSSAALTLIKHHQTSNANNQVSK